MTEVQDELQSLNDTSLTVNDPAEDIRDRDVLDAAGEKIGHVSDLLVDQSERKVRLMEVAHGGLLGIGEEKVVIPIDAITKVDADTVHVDRTREHVAGAPAYDPDVVKKQAHYSDLYGYYGFTPFWGVGYAYPGFPYYR